MLPAPAHTGSPRDGARELPRPTAAGLGRAGAARTRAIRPLTIRRLGGRPDSLERRQHLLADPSWANLVHVLKADASVGDLAGGADLRLAVMEMYVSAVLPGQRHAEVDLGMPLR